MSSQQDRPAYTPNKHMRSSWSQSTLSSTTSPVDYNYQANAQRGLPPLDTTLGNATGKDRGDMRAAFRQSTASSTPVLEKQDGKDVNDNHHTVDINDPNRPRYPLRQRLHHFTWAWYTLAMSTGGLSLLIFAQPFQFPGLRSIGLAVYILNILFVTAITSTMVTRFFLYPGDFKRSLTHPREGFFVPTLFLTTATLITSTQRYAVTGENETHAWAIQTAFWGYVIVTLALAVGQYSYVFAAHSFGLQSMMPTWILPIFPIMLSGTIASVIADPQPDMAAVPIIVAGLTCQGLGLSVAVMMYAHMVGRLMQTGLPNREHRPGLFMCVGPPSFTALAIIGMANGLPENVDPHGSGAVINVAMIRTIALMGAIFLWALSLWWFGIAVVAISLSPPKYFHLGWWAAVFPNTGFILATISIGNELQSQSVLIAATVMSIMLLLTYGFVFFNNLRAVLVQDIMYPGRDEDVEDH
ncbi:voltage-dependent anion channel domain-containing protein [Sarocladium implicatum]|nr:voltage-dependent anion channel domain-containing protein [Sarocladium implicatum]